MFCDNSFFNPLVLIFSKSYVGREPFVLFLKTILILINNQQDPAKGIALMTPVVRPDENGTSI